MHGIRSGPRSLFSGLAIVAMVATACNSSVSPSASSAPAESTVAIASATPAPAITPAPFDMTKFDPGLRTFFDLGENGATIGVPFATYPSFLWYNKALFDEAKLPLPPTKVGEQYQGKTWDMAALRELAMKLTVDKNGNDATSPGFDASNIVQW